MIPIAVSSPIFDLLIRYPIIKAINIDLESISVPDTQNTTTTNQDSSPSVSMDKMYKSRIEFKEGEIKAKREYDKTNDDLYKKEGSVDDK